jgi:hypothetical protein
MFKVTGPQLRVHWCSDISVAKKVSDQLSKDFKCDCSISEIPEKKTWHSQTLMPFWCEDIDLENFYINKEVSVSCLRSEIKEAVRYARGDLAQIVSSEVFCFLLDDAFWQQQYKHENKSSRNK